MPNKLNHDRRHDFATVERRVTSWQDYDAALVRRGDLTEAAMACWHTPVAGKRGGPSSCALQTSNHLTPVRIASSELLAHISPLGWAHIPLTGKYRWAKETVPAYY